MSQTLERPELALVRAAKPRRADGDLVQSLMRALTLMEILSEKGCRLTELSQRAKLPPSTTHRLLTTLEQKRFVRFDREESVWTVGSQCFAIGAGFLRRRDFITEAVPRIEGLASRLGATVNLGVLENGNLLLVKQASNTPMSPAQPPGSALPLHATAMGKILLANAADAGQVSRYMSGGLARLTERTICEPSNFARELQTIRQDGIAVDHEESMAGRRCIAAPIHNELGHCIAAISVTATRSQMTDTTVARLSALLSATAAEINLALDECKRIVELYRRKYHGIVKTWRWLNNSLSRIRSGECEGEMFGPCALHKGRITLPSGMELFYENLKYLNEQWTFEYGGKAKHIYGGKLLENIVQALDWVFVAGAAIRIKQRACREEGIVARLAHQVHDELIYVPKLDEFEKLKLICGQEMARRPVWGPDLPVSAECKVGPNYGELVAC